MHAIIQSIDFMLFINEVHEQLERDNHHPVITPFVSCRVLQTFLYLPVINRTVSNSKVGFPCSGFPTILPVCAFNVWELREAHGLAHADLTLTMNRNTAAARRGAGEARRCNGTVVYH